MTLKVRTESFYASFKVLTDEGYLKVAGIPKKAQNTQGQKDDETEDVGCDTAFLDMLKDLKKGSHLPVKRLMIKEGRDVASEALQFRFTDSGNGKCRTADRR